MRTARRRRDGAMVLSTGAALAILLGSASASAGGIFFTDRGVRPMGRGGAFVAGADDLGAIFYNPAGIVEANRQFLADASFLLFHSEYTRVSRVRQLDPNTDEPTAAWDQTYPTAEGSAPIIPIPTLAVSYDFGLKNTAFALGMYAPYAAGARYENTVAGEPNPGRYMLLNLDGSALAVPGIWAAHSPVEWVSVGAGFQMLMGNYRSQTVMSTCLPDRFVCAPEDPDYDSVAQLDVGPIYSPGANFGVIFKPLDMLRIGASYQLPFHVEAPSTVQVRIPSAPFFDRAYQDGDKAQVEMDFPWILRVGVELRLERVRAEIAYVHEAWSMHDRILITPDNMVLRDVELFPAEYRVQPLTVPRNFRDTSSVRLGGETWFMLESYRLDARAGLMIESSAVPDEYLSTLTIDLPKYILGLGGSLHVNDHWRFDVMYAHVFTSSVDVSPDDARYPQLNPVRSNPPRYPNYVNGGRYAASADILGVGMAVNY